MALNIFRRGGGGGGGGAYGGIPAAIGIPPSTYEQTAGVVPNLGALSSAAGRFAGTELAGQLSPETIAAIQDQGAAWGVQSGMPGSGLAMNRSLRNLGLNVEALQRQGVGDYLNILGGTSRTMTDPQLAAMIADRNAVYAAAPDPAAAAAEMERRWTRQFNLTRGGGSTPLTWYDLTHPQQASVMAGPGGTLGTGYSPAGGSFDAGAGGPPMVALSSTATGYGQPSPWSPAQPKQPFDEVLDAYFNPESYYWGGPEPEMATAE